MVRRRVEAYLARIRAELEAAFAEEHTPSEIAGSFAFGTFVTTLPTLGTGLIVLGAVAYLDRRASKLALFAPVVILNPLAKWGVHGLSLWLGFQVVGPLPDIALADISYTAGSDIVLRLLVGNFLLAVVFTIVGYAIVHRLVREYRRLDIDLGEIVVDRVTK